MISEFVTIHLTLSNDTVVRGKNYKYTDEILFTRNMSKKVYAYIQWSGQETGRDDHLVDKGAIVVVRHRINSFFDFLGRVVKKKLISVGDPSIKKPARYELIVLYNSRSGTVLDKYDRKNENGHFKKSAFRQMGLSTNNGYSRGIVKHTIFSEKKARRFGLTA